ncbi:coiled-coil domain-containing protein [Staphylococcus aureus]|uniref:coiled-coil domain-containing protein n=1 Tax=Staphylococcus aureus TaxID=1280 RepID=UPI00215CDE96|nr:hypothetical protein [Staphylococcus aureus]UVI86665.1 hypothetical protein NW951_08875 [Staphylococcus aureus]UVJ27820.1 hypothetical protein NW963_08860 [Staphylococcus aureus]
MLKARIQKTSNKKLFKQLNIGIGKSYFLKEIDFLINLLVEEISVKSNKSQTNEVINIKLELVDNETKVIRWYNEDIELNSYLEFISSDIIENTLNKENSLLKNIIMKDLNQDPEVDETDKEEFFKLYDESYDVNYDSKDKKMLDKLPNFFKSRKKNKDVCNDSDSSDISCVDDVSSFNKKDERLCDDNNFDDIFEESEPQFEDYQITEQLNSLNNNTELKRGNEEYKKDDNKGNNQDDKENPYSLPINIPSYVYEEPIKRVGETPLDELRADFLFTRGLEREQYRKTLFDSLIHNISQKNSELNSKFERKISLFKEENTLTDDEIEALEKEKRDELNKQIDNFKKVEEKNIASKLSLLKEEFDIKLKEKEQLLENEFDEKIQIKISENEKIINDYIITCMQTQDNLISLDIKDLTNKFNLEKIETLNLELNKYETELNKKLMQFDEDTYNQLNEKIYEFKQELISKQLRHNQKIKLENEQLKLKTTLKQAKEREDEVEKAKEEAKIREYKFKEEQEKARILELELDKEKQKYNNKLLLETERKNELKQRELDILDFKNKNRLTVEKNEERKDKTNKITYKSILILTLIIIITCLTLVIFTNLGIKNNNFEQTNNIETQNKKEDLDSLLSKREYDKALKFYPNNISEIINHAFKNKDVHALETIVAVNDNIQAKINKALLENDPKTTIDLYLNYKNKVKLSESDLEHIGLMMLEEKKVEDAIDINKTLNSKKLEEKIEEFKILSKYRENKNKETINALES